MHRTSRRQARQDHGCRNVPRGHDEQTQQTGIPCLAPPDPPYLILARQQKRLPAAVAGAMLGRSRPPRISTRSPARSLPETRAQEPLGRAGERPNAAPRVDPSAIGWPTQRIVSRDVPNSRSDHRHESPTAAERADTSKRSRSPAPSRLSAVAGRERASARGWLAYGGARLRWQRRR